MLFKRNDESARIAKLEAHMERIGAQIEAAEKALKRLIDDVEEMDDKYTRLRGLVYARKLHKEPKESDESAPDPSTGKMTRQELKAYLTRSGRFTPGKPTIHND